MNTDVIIAGGYLIYTEIKDLAKHAFEPLGEEFRQEMFKYAILVVVLTFGCGSAWEQEATAIKAIGKNSSGGKVIPADFLSECHKHRPTGIGPETKGQTARANKGQDFIAMVDCCGLQWNIQVSLSPRIVFSTSYWYFSRYTKRCVVHVIDDNMS